MCSLTADLAQDEVLLIGARLAQGLGAALMAPAALSILTTTFREGADRHRRSACGARSAASRRGGVFLGGALTEGVGWRWVFFVNLPVCALALGGAYC